MGLVRAVRMEVVDLIMAVVVVTVEGEAAMVVAVEGAVESVRERPRPESVLYIPLCSNAFRDSCLRRPCHQLFYTSKNLALS